MTDASEFIGHVERIYPDHCGTRSAYKEAGRSISSSMGKALADVFQYAMGLKDGTIIRYGSLSLDNPGWVHLTDIDDVYVHGQKLDYSFERGMEVAIADIVWHCDAPYGS